VSESDQMNRIAAEWVKSRDVIAQALREIVGGSDNQEDNAAAIIARLSHAGFTLENVDSERFCGTIYCIEETAETGGGPGGGSLPGFCGSLDSNDVPSGRGGGGAA